MGQTLVDVVLWRLDYRDVNKIIVDSLWIGLLSIRVFSVMCNTKTFQLERCKEQKVLQQLCSVYP